MTRYFDVTCMSLTVRYLLENDFVSSQLVEDVYRDFFCHLCQERSIIENRKFER